MSDEQKFPTIMLPRGAKPLEAAAEKDFRPVLYHGWLHERKDGWWLLTSDSFIACALKVQTTWDPVEGPVPRSILRGGGFMGRSWDSFVPGPAYWRACLRVLKPGGHLLAVRFISAEPLLGPLVHDVPEGWERIDGEDWGWPGEWSDGHEGPQLDLAGIDWLILSGESGSGHRPLDVQWMRDLRDAAEARGTALFVKQLGGHCPGTALEALPEDLRIREFPAVHARAQPC